MLPKKVSVNYLQTAGGGAAREGLLWKEGRGLLSNWERRYWVLWPKIPDEGAQTVSSLDLSQTDRKPFVWAGALGGRLLFYFKDIDSTQAQGVILLPSAEPPSGRGTWADSKRPAHTARLAKKKRDIDRSKYKADYLCCKMVCSEIKEVKGGQMVLQDRELILGSKQADEDNFREWEDLLVPDLKEPPPLIAGVRLSSLLADHSVYVRCLNKLLRVGAAQERQSRAGGLRAALLPAPPRPAADARVVRCGCVAG